MAILTGASLPNIYHGRPMIDSNDNIYVVAIVGGNLAVFKSDDDGSSFSVVDAAGKPAETNINCIATVLVGDTIHIATATNAASADYLYHRFHVSSHGSTPDEWDGTIIDETIETSVTTDLSNTAFTCCDIAVRSDGDVIVVYNGASDTVMSTAYSRVDYAVRVSSWTTGVAVDDGGEDFFNMCRIVMGASDKAHIMYYNDDGNDWYHKSLSSADSLSSAEQINDSNTFTAPDVTAPDIVYYDSGGDEIIVCIFRSFVSSATNIWSAKITNDGTPSADSQVSDSGNYAFARAAAAADDVDNKAYVVFAANSDFDLYIDSETFGTDVEIADAVTVDLVGTADVYEIGDGSRQLAIVWDNNGTITYTHYEVEAASTTITPSAATATGSTSVGTVDASIDSLNASATGNTSLASTNTSVSVLNASASGNTSHALAVTIGGLNANATGNTSLATSNPTLDNLNANAIGSTEYANANVGGLTPGAALATGETSVTLNTSVSDLNAEATGNTALATANPSISNLDASAVGHTSQAAINTTISNLEALATGSTALASVNSSIGNLDATATGETSLGNLNVTITSLEAAATGETSLGSADVSGGTTLSPDAALATGSTALASLATNISNLEASAIGNTSQGAINRALDSLNALATGNTSLATMGVSLASLNALATANTSLGAFASDLAALNANATGSTTYSTLAIALASLNAQATGLTSIGNVVNTAPTTKWVSLEFVADRPAMNYIANRPAMDYVADRPALDYIANRKSS